MKNYPLIIAHRGASGLVEHENTFEAFDKAIEVGADGIELDIRRTKDLILVINHDANIEDLIISEHTYQELLNKTLSIGYILPKFEDVLIKYQNIILLDIELKEVGYEQDIISITTKYLKYENYFLKTFNITSLTKIKEINPLIQTSLLIGEKYTQHGFFGRIKEVFPSGIFKKYKCDILSPNQYLFVFWYLKRMAKRNIPVNVWTVNKEKTLRKMMNSKYCPKYIVTNYPDLAIKIRSEIKK